MAKRARGYYKRGAVWYLDFQHRGERHRRKIGDVTEAFAKDYYTAFKADVLRGELRLNPVARKDVAFNDMVQEFLEQARVNLRPASHVSYVKLARILQRTFGGKRLSEINAWLIEKYKRDRVRDKDRRHSVNQELGILRALINKAVEWDMFEGENPVHGPLLFDLPENGRERFLDHDEEDRLLNRLLPCYQAVALVGIHAGLRIPSEALALRWTDLDLDAVNPTLTVRAETSKGKRTRTVELNQVLRETFKALPQVHERVFTFPNGEPIERIQKPVKVATKALKLTGITPHSFRHTFCSRLAMAGVPLRTIQELGGWKNLRDVQRYAHLSPEHRLQAVETTIRPPTPCVTGASQQEPKEALLRAKTRKVS